MNKLPTPDSLKDPPPCYHGLGWYWRRDGRLTKAVLDLREHIADAGKYPIRCCCEMIGKGVDGYTATGGDTYASDDADLVLFAGPDKPEQLTYAEYYAANKPKPREYWLVVPPVIPHHAMAFETFEQAYPFKNNDARVVHVREVVE